MLYLIVAGVYSVVNLTFAFIIVAKAHKTALSRFYLFCVSCLISMSLAAYALTLSPDPLISQVLRLFVEFFYSLFPFFFLHFVAMFVRRFDILRSKHIPAAIYSVGLFSYAMVLLRLIPEPIQASGAISQSGYIFYLTWMTVLFAIGVAMLYEISRKFYEKPGKSNILFACFALLLLVLPGPFTESVFFRILGIKADWYYFISTFAVLIAVYFVFRHKIIVNTFYDSLKSALAVMNDVFITTDAQFNIEMAKGTAITSLLGYEEGELLGAPFVSLLGNKDFLEEYKFFLSQRKMKECFFDADMVCKNGERLQMNISLTPMVVNEQVTGFLSVCRDIRDRKRLEDELRHAQKMKSLGTLAGGIAHDFNNILQIILLNTASLEQKNNLTESKIARTIDINREAVERGTGLVRQILTFARKTDVKFTVFSLQDFLARSFTMMKETFPRTISFTFDYDPTLPPIFADQNQIHQVLLNLCVNARDAMPNGGTMSVATRQVNGETIRKQFASATHPSYACISLSDSGAGMEPATLQRIYEPFFTTKEQGKGTGLGLSVVHSIVEGHRGFIDVTSAPGVGTTFHVYIPFAQLHTLTPSQGGAIMRKDTRGSETILIVEDEQYLLQTMCTLLGNQGYYVLTAVDGYEAVEVYRNHYREIDLVITDLGLPKLSGWDVFLQMKELNPQVRVIIATGYLDPQTKEGKFEVGIMEIIKKPFDSETLLTSVRHAIDGVHPEPGRTPGRAAAA
ncbi:MAG TPA: ATP-binding protein [Bacteroidota bacterium]|jgi:PAS domain S-box-containing protein|nr:ATP-binding protein [Bacteroidota bacterium]